MLKCSKIYLLSIAVLVSLSQLYSQVRINPDSLDKNTKNKRLKIICLSEGTLAVSSYLLFNHLWYDGFEKSKFHFFNDGSEWYGMDKMGHAYSSYWISNYSAKIFAWSGLSRKKSAIIGSASSFIYMASIELLDGYSAEWGASVWDLTANAGGAALFLVQELGLKQQLITMKYSYFPSSYAKYRPNVLGKNFGEKLIKDYNATKFWLSIDLHSIVSQKIPPWLNLAIGYGASGMTGGFENYYSPDCNCQPVTDSKRASEYYLSLDLNLSKIKVKSRFVKNVFNALNMIKFPAPALRYSRDKWQLMVR